MKYFSFILFLILSVTSCEESSNIKPLAEAKTISDRFAVQGERGTQEITIPIKISLTQNLLPRYDLQDILDDVEETDSETDAINENDSTSSVIENLPPKQRSFLKKWKDTVKYKPVSYTHLTLPTTPYV